MHSRQTECRRGEKEDIHEKMVSRDPKDEVNKQAVSQAIFIYPFKNTIQEGSRTQMWGQQACYWSPKWQSYHVVMLPSHDAPYTSLTCCPVTHLAVL